jgi:hypothetical protein
MKIGIITFSRAKNFGAVLQTYALYTFLKKRGQDVEIIDYVTERCAVDRSDYVEIRTKNSRFWGHTRYLKMIWKKLYLKQEIREHEHFFKFLRGRVKMTDCFYSEADLLKSCPKFDVYITGSDQVWNTDFTWDHCIDKPYFLSFAPNDRRKISYASSFGKIKIDIDTLKNMKKYLTRYHAISVREESAVNILKDIGLSSTAVLDPTFLLNSNEWGKICSEKPYGTSYILLFLIHPNKKLLALAQKIGLAKKLQVIVLVSSEKNKKRLHNKAIIPSVEEWLSYFRNADYVITDSFHGTVFSIQFHRSFLVDGIVQYNNRIVNMLGKFELNERILNRCDLNTATRILDKNIDYMKVDLKVGKLKNNSEQWLLENLSEVCYANEKS